MADRAYHSGNELAEGTERSWGRGFGDGSSMGTSLRLKSRGGERWREGQEDGEASSELHRDTLFRLVTGNCRLQTDGLWSSSATFQLDSSAAQQRFDADSSGDSVCWSAVDLVVCWSAAAVHCLHSGSWSCTKYGVPVVL